MTRNRLLATASLCVVMTALAACGSSRDPGGTRIASKGNYKPYRPYIVGVPYTIKGIRYYPKENLNYEETGVASWYGPGFHGKRTANGEQYNQSAMTAAHRTLPMPSIVKVTRLDNGRSIVVRINDRGPFADDRIIDLSKEGARRLGMLRAGTARVRVTLLKRETVAMKRNRQVYADMAALNRRYVDGVGSGPVVREKPADPPARNLADRAETPAVNAKPTVRPDQRYGSDTADRRDRDTSIDRRDDDGRGAGPIRTTTLGPPMRLVPSDDGKYKVEPRSGRTPDAGSATPRRNVSTRPVLRSGRDSANDTPPLRRPPPATGRIYVQAAAYTERSTARAIRARLDHLGRTRITPVKIRRTLFYRVQVGPVRTTREGDRLLARVVALGYRNARVVISPVN